MKTLNIAGFSKEAIIAEIKSFLLDEVEVDYSASVASSNWYEPDSYGEIELHAESIKIENIESEINTYLELPEQIIVKKWINDEIEVEIAATMDLKKFKTFEFENEIYDIYEFYNVELV